MRQQIKYIFD